MNIHQLQALQQQFTGQQFPASYGVSSALQGQSPVQSGVLGMVQDYLPYVAPLIGAYAFKKFTEPQKTGLSKIWSNISGIATGLTALGGLTGAGYMLYRNGGNVKNTLEDSKNMAHNLFSGALNKISGMAENVPFLNNFISSNTSQTTNDVVPTPESAPHQEALDKIQGICKSNPFEFYKNPYRHNIVKQFLEIIEEPQEKWQNNGMLTSMQFNKIVNILKKSPQISSQALMDMMVVLRKSVHDSQSNRDVGYLLWQERRFDQINFHRNLSSAVEAPVFFRDAQTGNHFSALVQKQANGILKIVLQSPEHPTGKVFTVSSDGVFFKNQKKIIEFLRNAHTRSKNETPVSYQDMENFLKKNTSSSSVFTNKVSMTDNNYFDAMQQMLNYIC